MADAEESDTFGDTYLTGINIVFTKFRYRPRFRNEIWDSWDSGIRGTAGTLGQLPIFGSSISAGTLFSYATNYIAISGRPSRASTNVNAITARYAAANPNVRAVAAGTWSRSSTNANNGAA